MGSQRGGAKGDISGSQGFPAQSGCWWPSPRICGSLCYPIAADSTPLVLSRVSVSETLGTLVCWAKSLFLSEPPLPCGQKGGKPFFLSLPHLNYNSPRAPQAAVEGRKFWAVAQRGSGRGWEALGKYSPFSTSFSCLEKSSDHKYFIARGSIGFNSCLSSHTLGS